jgi:gamma-butyrobetaine dioxygenase
MISDADFSEIRARMFQQINARGYDVLPPLDGFDADSAARDPWEIATRFLGEPPRMVERQPIKPVAKGRSFASNSAFTPLHTDSQMFSGVSPHAQLMFCAKAAIDGGQTLLLDTHLLLASIRREDPQLFLALFTHTRHIPFVFGDVIGPTVSWRRGCLVFTHSPMRVDDEIGRALQSFWAKAQVIEVAVPDGHILVVDNHRMLHGRSAFKDESRRFTRLLVWRRDGFSRHAVFEALARTEAERTANSISGSRILRARGLTSDASEEAELRRRIVLEMLRGIPPGVLAQRHGVPEPQLYVWRDAAIAAMETALLKIGS